MSEVDYIHIVSILMITISMEDMHERLKKERRKEKGDIRGDVDT